MWLASAGPEVSELGATGNWSAWQGVPSGGHEVQSIAAVAGGGTLRVVELMDDRRTVGVADRVNGGWTVGHLTLISSDTTVSASRIAAADVGGDLQVTARYDYLIDPSHFPRILHGILNAAGSWSGFADLSSAITNPGVPCDVAMAGANGEMQLAYSGLAGGLLHTIRHRAGTERRAGGGRRDRQLFLPIRDHRRRLTSPRGKAVLARGGTMRALGPIVLVAIALTDRRQMSVGAGAAGQHHPRRVPDIRPTHCRPTSSR